jgi:hypothetical protein
VKPPGCMVFRVVGSPPSACVQAAPSVGLHAQTKGVTLNGRVLPHSGQTLGEAAQVVVPTVSSVAAIWSRCQGKSGRINGIGPHDVNLVVPHREAGGVQQGKESGIHQQPSEVESTQTFLTTALSGLAPALRPPT